MKILMLSYDSALVDGSRHGDTVERHKHYAEYTDRMDIVVFAPEDDEGVLSWLDKGIVWYRGFRKAYRLYKQYHHDIVVSQDALIGALGILLRWRFGVKVQVCLYGGEIFTDHWLKLAKIHRLYKLVMCWVLKHADSIRTDLDYDKMRLVCLLKIAPEKIAVIPLFLVPEAVEQMVKADGTEVREKLLRGI